MGKRKLGATALLIAGLTGLAPGWANAAALIIDDSAPNDTVTVTACDFENGAFLNGSLMGLCGVGFGGTATVPESAGPLTFSGGWLTPGGAGSGSRTIYFVEAADPTAVSDVLTYSWVDAGGGATNILVSFESGLTGVALPGGVSPGDVFVETAGPVNFALPFLTGQVITAAAVPEPTSLALLGLGIAGAGLKRRRRD